MWSKQHDQSDESIIIFTLFANVNEWELYE